MWISEVKTKEKGLGSFCHRETFETLEKGREWASELAFRIVSRTHWMDDEIVMNHREFKELT